MDEEKITQETEEAEGAENRKEPKAIKMPDEMAADISKGVFKLVTPITDGEETYEELKYDFSRLLGWDIAAALDSGTPKSNDVNGISGTQALALFAAAAGKATKGLDAEDIRTRIGPVDAVAAMSISRIFFRSSLWAGSMRITRG